MTVGKEFHDWSDHPSEEAKRTERGSPALMHIRDYHLRRWGGVSLSVSSLYQPRLIPGTGKLSAHAGSAVDIRWENPGPGRQIVINEILPFYIQNSLEIHLQAIHDYVGCRVWRANRSDDAAGGWRTQPKGSHEGKMGDPSAQWLHLEINETGWSDDRSVEEMLGADGTGTIEGDEDLTDAQAEQLSAILEILVAAFAHGTFAGSDPAQVLAAQTWIAGTNENSWNALVKLDALAARIDGLTLNPPDVEAIRRVVQEELAKLGPTGAP